MSDITALNRKRGGIKSQLTKLNNVLTEGKDKMDIPELQAQLDSVLNIKQKYEALKEEYYRIPKEEEFQKVEASISEVDDDLQELEVSLKTSINKLKCIKIQNETDNSINNEHSKKPPIKLPKIPLPFFSGKFEEWNLFKTQFNSLISENAELSENEKLHYLRGSLKGEAKIVETADDNFCSLFKALEQRYENKRIIVNCHIKNILNIQPLKHESGKDLRYVLDTILKNLRSLKLLEFKRDKLSDALLLNIVLDKLDRDSRKQYELTLKDNDVPEFNDFLEFLERRCQILNNIQANIPFKFNNEKSKSFFIKADKSQKPCIACKTQIHALYHCNAFKEMKLSERLDLVQKNRLCKNCLSEFHPLAKCNSKGSCFVCKKKLDHHTLLHKYSTPTSHNNSANEIMTPTHFQERKQQTNSEPIDTQVTVATSSPRLSFFCNGNKSILINTAIVYVKDAYGEFKALRAVLDSASESSFLSTSASEILGLKKQRVNIPICGLNESSLNVKKRVSAILSDENKNSFWEIDLLIVPNIANLTPSKRLNISSLNIPSQVKLADPSFHIPQKIDILLGAELFFSFLNIDKIKLADNLFLQSSVFGYLVSGVVSDNNCYNSTKHCFLTKNLDILDKTLHRFWEIEEVETSEIYSDELKYCNEHFAKTHFRKPDGKFVVEMPFKPDSSEKMLGNSKAVASRRLDQLWTRLERDPAMQTLYSEFLSEYELLQHMEEVKEDSDVENGYYLPHHGVLRPSSKTTKLRVVFNASAKTSSGHSLNDLLCKGGVIQEDLFSILIRFRKHAYAFTADIKQMFRMIEINPSQTKLQKILWKNNKTAPTKVYELRTVTYGTASAPYLATRVLQQLALDEEKDFPLASKAVLQDFYMDDCLSGASELTEFEKLKSELTQLLQRGGMTLHKWCSNKAPSTELREFSLDRNSEEVMVKTLGMLWNSSSDSFTYKVTTSTDHNYTKRDVLSQIARIYDPLGLLGPIIAKAKIFMQQLWLLKLDWNETLPPDVSTQWRSFIQTLKDIESIHFPRCFLVVPTKFVVLHGFADASSKAYGAVIYVQTDETTNQLLCSKSRVAPTKSITIPRLELCSCLLLAKLIHKVIAALKLQIDSVVLYSDSTIALAWINSSSNLLKTFVSNRVSQIQQLSKDFQWKHIPSELNPADLLSRGLDVKALAASELWFKGPDFSKLSLSSHQTVQISSDLTDKLYIDELKPVSKITLTLNNDCEFLDNLLAITNDFLKLIRIVAFIFRFFKNSKYHVRETGLLKKQEYANAERALLKLIQVRYFTAEIAALKRGSSVPSTSKLRFLNPFIDKSDGLIRVGGRLAHSNLNFSQKHPVILPAGTRLVKLIFQYYHNRELHVGPQALLNTVRQKYWPLGGRNTARKIVHECVQCFKMKPIAATQIMGDLPPERVTTNAPFFNVGLDLCGPFLIQYKGQRKGTMQKVYVSIFVCMVTKAIHLEFISDLTSESLIATLKRFFARRGKSSTIFCDNATNFVGACAELKRFQKLISKNEDVSHFLATDNIEWKFLPPRAPNFGGLWEAGVKSFKYHFKRTVGSAKLTLEEFITVIVQIEGILNSRPLTPLSPDSDDYQVLTPGHFLVGRPINAIPEPSLIEKRDNLLNRWQRAQKLVQIVWKKWRNSYLSHLQQRSKWLFKKQNIVKGMLVILKDSNLPVNKWPLARITNVCPGADGNIRVVDLRTPTGNFRRCISKICILPIEDNNITSVT